MTAPQRSGGGRWSGDGFACELKQVSKSFDGRRILDGFGLSVVRGEWVAVTGPSGSGKSVLSDIIALRVRPDQGEVRLFGALAPKVGSRPALELLRTGVSHLPQQPPPSGGGTVADRLRTALVGRPRQPPTLEVIEEALGAVGLNGTASRPWRDLSPGEQQRVALAHAVWRPCELLVADEPVAALDPADAEIALGLLAALHSRGTTIIVTTGDPGTVARSGRCVDLHGRPSAHW